MREPHHRSRLRELRDLAEVIAIIAAGTWALYIFVYEQRIKPGLQQPSAVIYADVRSFVSGGKQFIVITRHFGNVGDVTIDVAAEAMSVYGETLVRRKRPSAIARFKSEGEIRADLVRSGTSLLFTYYRLRAGAIGGEPNGHILLRPHSSFAERYVVVVPAGEFQMVRVRTDDVTYKVPSTQRIRVRVAREALGGFVLRESSVGLDDFDDEYPLGR